MAYVEVDVDMGEFETYELIDELVKRFKSFGRKKPGQKQIDSIKQELNDLSKIIGLSVDRIEIKTLDDKLKVEHFAEVFSKYSLSEIQSKLPI